MSNNWSIFKISTSARLSPGRRDGGSESKQVKFDAGDEWAVATHPNVVHEDTVIVIHDDK